MHADRALGPSSTVDGARRAALRWGGLVAVAVAAGVLDLRRAMAAVASPFDATLMDDVLRQLGGTPAPSAAIDLDLPELTENGAMVPVSVTSRLPRTTQIVLLADANPFPLAASFDVVAGTEPFISTRLKLAQSCVVSAVVRADGRLYATTRSTSVMVGGCGD